MPRPLDDLVLDCLDRLEETGDDLDAVLIPMTAAHPEHAAALRERMEALERVGLIGAPPGSSEEYPNRIGDFDLVRRLGGGGMGVVYLATQRSMQRRVAVKLVRPGHFFHEGTRARFRREAEAAARLSHPNIVQVHTFGEEAGVPYLAMEYVRGSSLDRILAKLAARRGTSLTGGDFLEAVQQSQEDDEPGHPAPDEAFFEGSATDVVLRIALGVARALAHAHERGVLQRDVKPSNIMLTVDGRVLLLDFGLSSLTGADRVTKSGSLVGSLPYMAPEQLRGEGEAVDARTDVYGLGVTMYEILTHRAPFLVPGSTERTRALILDGRPTPPRRLDASIPKDVESVCLVAMDSDPGHRYESAHALCADLQNVIAHRPIHARPAGMGTHLARWARRRPGAAAAVAMGFLLVVGGPTVLAWQSSKANARLEEEVERADKNRTDTLAALALANRNHEATLVALRRADDNFQRALGALALVTRVAIDDLGDVPMAERGRRDVLLGVAAFQGELAEAAGAPGDSEFELQRAAALTQLGHVQAALDELDAAAASLEEAISIFEERGVEAGSPHAGDLARAHSYLGRIEDRRGRSASVVPHFESALDLYSAETEGDVQAILNAARVRRDLIHHWRQTGKTEHAREELLALIGTLEAFSFAEHPDVAELAAWCYSESTVLDTKYGNRKDRRAGLERALEINELLVQQDPEDRIRRQKLVIALSNLGAFLLQGGEQEEALLHLGRAEETAEDLVVDYPGINVYRYNLSGVLINASAGHLTLSERVDAEENTRLAKEKLVRATEILLRLLTDHPQEVDYRLHYASAALNLASIRNARGEYSLTLEDLERLDLEVAVLERIRPSDFQVAQVKAISRINRIRAHVGLEQIDEACRTAEVLLERGDASLQWEAARVLGLVLNSEGAPSEGIDRTRATIIELLYAAVEGGYDAAAIPREERFAPLLDEEDVRALIGR